MNYLAVITGYFLGSIPFGYIVTKYWKGINIFEHGSGNIGFTNVLRTVGWPPAVVVLIGDVTKGAFSAWLGLKAGGEVIGILSGMAAMLGHSYSIFLKFRGGKLVATGLGTLIALSPKVAAVLAVVWLLTLALFKYVSLSSILAAITVFPVMFLLNESLPMKVFLSIAAVFLILRHRSNISRLLNGTEYKINQKK